MQEVIREIGVLCMHTNSETSSLTADPKQHIPNAFRTARQGVHDSIAGGSYAAAIAKAKGLKKWATCGPDYAYGRDIMEAFTVLLKKLKPGVEIVDMGYEYWPTAAEASRCKELFDTGRTPEADLLWALLNSPEFLFTP